MFFFSGPTSSLSSLIHAATLIVQQLHRGISLSKSFYRACWEVYVCSQQLQHNRKVNLCSLKTLSKSVFCSEKVNIPLLVLSKKKCTV